MLIEIKNAAIALALFTALTGVVYPLAVTGIAKVAFSKQAAGSLEESNGAISGSHLIGQSFDDPKYFWGRLSATGPTPYNAQASTGSNYGPTNPALTAAAKARVDALHAADPANTALIPVDLVTASGSGLDPHISPQSAIYQSARVARVRKLDESQVRSLIDQHTEQPTLGILGEPRVNVLELNRDLDATH